MEQQKKKPKRIEDLLSRKEIESFLWDIHLRVEDNKVTSAYYEFINLFNRTIQTIKKADQERERNFTHEVEEWTMSSSGVFLSSEVARCLQLSSRQELKNLSLILSRLCEKNVIERYGKKHGVFRKIEREFEIMEWWKAPTTSIDFKFPFGLDEIADIPSKSIIIFAGVPDAGKTSSLLECVRLNIERYKMFYFNSDSGDSEIRKRIEKIEETNLEKWRPPQFTMIERAGCYFSDVIQPNSINLIDFLEEPEGEAYRVKEEIRRIWEKLENGIAIIALQKHSQRDYGYGGEPTLQKARLYLALDRGKIKIVKCKGWKTERNPYGMVCNFKLVNGWKFLPDEWHFPEDEKLTRGKWEK